MSTKSPPAAPIAPVLKTSEWFTGSMRHDIAAAVGQATVSAVTTRLAVVSKSVNSDVIQTQVMNLTCGDDKGACAACLPFAFEGEDYLRNFSAVEAARNGPCAYVCKCGLLGAFQDQTVTVTEGESASSADIDIDDVTATVLATLKSKYGDLVRPTADDVAAIVDGKTWDGKTKKYITADTSASIVQVINKKIAATQLISVEGAGQVRNVAQRELVDAVMASVLTASVSVLDKVVDDTVNVIREIDKDFVMSFKQVFAKSELYFYLTGGLAGGLLVTLVALLVWRQLRQQ